MVSKRNFFGGLYLVANFTDRSTTSFVATIGESLRGGVDIVQLRAKALPFTKFLELARLVHEVCRDYGKPLIINDSLEIARQIGAEGLHVGCEDEDIKTARFLLGDDAIIGRSLAPHDPAIAFEDADYLAASPVFLTSTKPELEQAFGLDGLATLIKRSSLPVVAIGGVNKATAKSVLDTGCRTLAVVSAIIDAASPYDEAKALKNIIRKAHV